MENSTEFKIAYDGDALRSHVMDVRDLAPALLAFGKLFDEANRVINGNKAIVKLKVKATSPASFDIFFILDQTFASQITGFLTGAEVTSALNLVALCMYSGSSVGGLIWLIRYLQGKKPTKVKDLKNGFVQLDIGSETFTVPIELLRLYQDVSVRTAVQEIVEPLTKDGIDTFKILDNKGKIVDQVKKEEAKYFLLPEIPDEIIIETQTDSAYSIVSLAFKEDNKWRLFDGSSTISVTLSDDDFRAKVDNNLIAFSKGDILICTVKTRQYRTNTGLRTEYDVLKVKEHRQAARQLSLFD